MNISWNFVPEASSSSPNPHSFDVTSTMYTPRPPKPSSSLIPASLAAPSLTSLLVDRLALSILSDEDRAAKRAAAKGLEEKNSVRSNILKRIISTFQDAGDDAFAKRIVENEANGVEGGRLNDGAGFDHKIKKTLDAQSKLTSLRDVIDHVGKVNAENAVKGLSLSSSGSQKKLPSASPAPAPSGVDLYQQLGRAPGQLTSSSSSLLSLNPASLDSAPPAPSVSDVDKATLLSLDRPPSPIVFARTLGLLRLVPDNDGTLPPQLVALQRDERRERQMWEAARDRERRKLSIRRSSVGKGVSLERRGSQSLVQTTTTPAPDPNAGGGGASP